jgi:hypothetical protein
MFLVSFFVFVFWLIRSSPLFVFIAQCLISLAQGQLYIRKVLLLHKVQMGYGVHPVSYQVGTGGFSPGIKAPED